MKTACSIAVPTSAGKTFAFLAHTPNEPRWRRAVTASRFLGAGTAELGVHGKTVSGRRAVTVHWFITEFEPGSSLSWQFDGDPWRGGGRYAVTAGEHGATVQHALALKLKGPARVFEPILWVYFRHALRRDLRRLAAVLAEAKDGTMALALG